MVISPEILLFYSIVLTILVFCFVLVFCFYMKFRIVLSKSVKNCVGILVGIALNLSLNWFWPFLLNLADP